jgi:hypothetical protein
LYLNPRVRTRIDDFGLYPCGFPDNAPSSMGEKLESRKGLCLLIETAFFTALSVDLGIFITYKKWWE